MLSTHAASINMQNCTACLISLAQRVQGLSLVLFWFSSCSYGNSRSNGDDQERLLVHTQKTESVVGASDFNGSFMRVAECVSGHVCVSHLGLISKGLVAPHQTHSGSNLGPEISVLYLIFYWSCEHFQSSSCTGY